MKRKPQSPGSHRADNPLKTAREPREIRRKVALVGNASRNHHFFSDEETTYEVSLRDKMLPGMTKRTRESHSRTAEIQKAPRLKKKIA